MIRFVTNRKPSRASLNTRHAFEDINEYLAGLPNDMQKILQKADNFFIRIFGSCCRR